MADTFLFYDFDIVSPAISLPVLILLLELYAAEGDKNAFFGLFFSKGRKMIIFGRILGRILRNSSQLLLIYEIDFTGRRKVF